jgi:Flp pilus assembly protein TadD
VTETYESAAEIEQAIQQGALLRAERLARKAVQRDPRNAQALSLLGSLQGNQGRFAEAEATLRQSLAVRPDDALTHNTLGYVLHNTGRSDDAETEFKQATVLEPRYASAWWNLLNLYMAREDNPASLHAIERLMELDPTSLRPRLMRSDVLRNTESARDLDREYRTIIADFPDSAWPWYGIFNLKTIRFSADDLAAMQALRARGVGDAQESIALDFAIGKALEDNMRYSDAFATFSAVNVRVRQANPWNADVFSANIEKILAATSALPASTSGLGGDCVLLVSLARAGSTLLEQILASHSNVTGAGEVRALEDVLNEESTRRNLSLTEWPLAATAQDWTRLGAAYVDRTARFRGRGKLVTDKKLNNWKYVGALFAMLPDARVINCRRDPVETGLSCFEQLFPSGEELYSYALTDIGAYWRDYDRACRTWAARFPDRFLDVRYEDLVAEPEATIRRVLAFCGLDFEPACLEFHKNKRSVVTISAAQVREPLRNDTARAAKYGALLDPLRDALGTPRFAG